MYAQILESSHSCIYHAPYLLDPGLAQTATKMVNPRETRWAVAPKTALRERYIRDSASIVRAMADGLVSSTADRMLIFHSTSYRCNVVLSMYPLLQHIKAKKAYRLLLILSK